MSDYAEATIALLAEQVVGSTLGVIETKAKASGIGDDAHVASLMMLVGGTLFASAMAASGTDPAAGKAFVLALIDEVLAS